MQQKVGVILKWEIQIQIPIQIQIQMQIQRQIQMKLQIYIVYNNVTTLLYVLRGYLVVVAEKTAGS